MPYRADDLWRMQAGPGGLCVCPNCGATLSHELGEPCATSPCPVCGAYMTRLVTGQEAPAEPETCVPPIWIPVVAIVAMFAGWAARWAQQQR